MNYKYLSVFSGIEAFSVAVQSLDFKAVAFSEIEDFPSRVLAHRYPDVPNLGDMMKIDTGKLGRVDWLVGGAPCQSFSVAGLRQGLADARGNLTLEYVRLAHELAEKNGLRGLLFENVPGILSQADNPFGCLLAGIVGHDDPLLPGDKPKHGKSNKFWRWIGAGYTAVLDEECEETGEFEEVTEGYHRPRWPDAGMVAGPRARLAWRILDSRFFAVAQRRRRVFVVADFRNGFDPATVLFEPRGKGRGFAPGGQAGQEIAGTLASRSAGGGGLGTDMELGGGLQVASVDVAPTLRAGGNSTGGDRPHGSDVDTAETLVIYEGNAEGGNAELPSINASNGKKGINNQTPLISVFAIQERAVSENPDAGPDGIGVQSDIAYTMEARGQTQAVAFGLTDSVTPKFAEEISPTLTITSSSGGGHPPSVIAFGSKDHGGDAGDISPTLKASGHTGSHANGGAPPAVAIAMRGRADGVELEIGDDKANALRTGNGGSSKPMVFQPKASHHQSMNPSDISPTLDKSKEVGIQSGPQVRRLTPEECEKLQGFPVGWTRIPGLSGWRTLGDDEDADEFRAAGMEVRTSKKTGKSRVNDPDGPRYKSLGNSFTTEPVNWIMSRVQASLRGEPMPRWQPMQLWSKTRP